MTDRWRVLQGDAKETLSTLPSESVHSCVTSPPYWGLRCYDVDGQLGLEDTIKEHITALLAVFEEVHRVLRSDGTLWLNYGDAYAGGGGGGYGHGKEGSDGASRPANVKNQPSWLKRNGFQAKDLMGLPWRVAFAMQDQGWILRQEVIWHKQNPMPESCRDRPTRAHEQVFLFAKEPDYFYDQHAIREPASENTHSRGRNRPPKVGAEDSNVRNKQSFHENTAEVIPTRNKRSVWTLTSQPYPEAHFATFPEDLVRPMIQAGTSERGACPECGAPWTRITEKETSYQSGSGRSGNIPEGKHENGVQGGGETQDLRRGPVNTMQTVGWESTCAHDTDPIPCTVLDPFCGSGTTLAVAKQLGRDGIGIELNPDYCKLARDRIQDANEGLPQMELSEFQARLGVAE